MPPEPYEYQGPARIGAFLRERRVSAEARRCWYRPAPTPNQHSAAYLAQTEDRATVRDARPDPRGPADLRDHLVRRQRVFPQFGLPLTV